MILKKLKLNNLYLESEIKNNVMYYWFFIKQNIFNNNLNFINKLIIAINDLRLKYLIKKILLKVLLYLQHLLQNIINDKKKIKINKLF